MFIISKTNTILEQSSPMFKSSRPHRYPFIFQRGENEYRKDGISLSLSETVAKSIIGFCYLTTEKSLFFC